MIEKNIKNTKLHVGVVALKSARHKGITLMALIITIVIMLILATVTIGAINGGLFDYAGKAKTQAEETSIKEGIQKAYILAQTTSKTNKVKEANMQKQIDQILVDQDAVVVQEGDIFIVEIGEKYYEVENNGKVTGPKVFEKLEYAGDITKGGTCTGTSAKPYRIECIEDLVKLAELTNKKSNIITTSKYYLLVKDLDFNSIFSYGNYRAKYSYDNTNEVYVRDENSTTTIKELCTTGQGFIPIGLSYSAGTNFKGIFYGEEQREIRNIYINRSGVAALFGSGSGVTIKKITIDGQITSTNGAAIGFIGTAYNTTINKCINKARIKGSSAAGFRGDGGKVTITECVNEGNIIASGIAVGISRSGNSTIKKCYNKGNITSSGSHASGIGDYKSAILNCYNSGNIKAGTGVCCASGISYWWSGDLYNCYNTGNITGACVSKASARYRNCTAFAQRLQIML